MKQIKQSYDDTNSPLNIKTRLYKHTDTVLLCTNLTDAWDMERTAKNVYTATSLTGCANATVG